MLAYTGYWRSSQYLAYERKRIEEERKRAAADRRAHRSLDRQSRLLADFAKLDTLLKGALRHKEMARAMRLLHKRNQIVQALNACAKQGASC